MAISVCYWANYVNDNCANVGLHAQHTAVLLFETEKLIYKTTPIILPRQLTPICPFICGKPIEFATFSRTVVITPVNNAKHQFPCHRKFMKHRVKRDLG